MQVYFIFIIDFIIDDQNLSITFISLYISIIFYIGAKIFPKVYSQPSKNSYILVEFQEKQYISNCMMVNEKLSFLSYCILANGLSSRLAVATYFTSTSSKLIQNNYLCDPHMIFLILSDTVLKAPAIWAQIVSAGVVIKNLQYMTN